MFCNNGNYFKIGLFEGKILSDILHGKERETIIEEENLTESEFDYIMNAFEEAGIWEPDKKEKFNPLYVKIPLFDANNLLGKICDRIKKCKVLSRIIFLLFSGVVAYGMLFTIWNFKDIFSMQSIRMPVYDYVIVYFLFTLIIFCHEMGHGITCKYFDGEVGKIGVAFIVFNPAMYCDISGVRMFKETYKQILSSMAGFFVNGFFIGVFAILLSFDKSNLWSALIILNATSIIINAIPFIRLDGYWILSFGLKVQNLHVNSMKKIKSIRNKEEFTTLKDYFILLYGVLNCCVILYCCICFIAKIWDLLHNIITV